jgi:O-antigen/teichoic acid export membrane protein
MNQKFQNTPKATVSNAFSEADAQQIALEGGGFDQRSRPSMRMVARHPALLDRGAGNHLSISMLQWIRYLMASHFLRNVAIVAGGTATAQIIAIAFSPILARLYGPEAFGILGVFMAALAVITPLSGLTYGVAIVLPASDDEARALLKLSLLIGLVVTILSAFIFGGFHLEIASTIGFTATSTFLLLAPLLILLSATAQPLQQWLVRKKQFRAISRIAVIESAATGTSKTAVGLIAATAPALLVLSTLASTLQTLLLWLSARHTLRGRSDRTSAGFETPDTISLKDVAYRYRDFPLFRAPQVWLNTVSHSLPTLMLAALLGPAAAGFYTIARRVLGLPSSLISGAVGTVFLPHIAEASHRSEKVRPLILQGTVGLALAGLLPFGVVVAFGPWLFGFVFGAEWVAAGQYARWLAVWLYFGLINIPSVQAIPLLGLQGQFLAYEIVVITLRAASLAFGALVLQSDLAAIALFSITGALANISMIVWVLSSDTRSREGESRRGHSVRDREACASRRAAAENRLSRKMVSCLVGQRREEISGTMTGRGRSGATP